MIQSKAATTTAIRVRPAPAAIRGRSLALPPEAKWSPRRTLLFVLCASTLGWLGILAALSPRL